MHKLFLMKLGPSRLTQVILFISHGGISAVLNSAYLNDAI